MFALARIYQGLHNENGALIPLRRDRELSALIDNLFFSPRFFQFPR